MIYSITKDKLIHNLCLFKKWEDKYLYIIELGNMLPKIDNKMKQYNNLIYGCQSQVWIIVEKIKKNKKLYLNLYGDSDSSIVKGLISIIFILYKNLTLEEILLLDINLIFDRLDLSKHLTTFRLNGIKEIIFYIKNKINKFIK